MLGSKIKIVDVFTAVVKAQQRHACLQSCVNKVLANGQCQTLSLPYKFENVNWQSGGEVERLHLSPVKHLRMWAVLRCETTQPSYVN